MEVFNSVTACFWLEIQFETSLWGEKIHGAAFFSSAESIFLPARTFSICDLAIILECFLKLNCVNPFYSCWATVCPHSFILSPSQVLLTQCVWSLIKGVVWCIWSLITNPLLSPFSFQMVTRTKKIFVGGLSANTVVEDVKQYFEQFGKVRPFLFFFCFLIITLQSVITITTLSSLRFRYMLQLSSLRKHDGAVKHVNLSWY